MWQQPERMRRIGVLMSMVESNPGGLEYITAFAQGLAELGWATQGYLSEQRRSHTNKVTVYFLNMTLRHRLCSKSFVGTRKKADRRALGVELAAFEQKLHPRSLNETVHGILRASAMGALASLPGRLRAVGRRCSQ